MTNELPEGFVFERTPKEANEVVYECKEIHLTGIPGADGFIRMKTATGSIAVELKDVRKLAQRLIGMVGVI